jgi:hypothetical protein
MINNKPLFAFTVLIATMLIWLSGKISMELFLTALALGLGFLFIIWPLSIKIRIANEEEKAQKFKDNERHYVSLQNKLGVINISSQIQEDELLELIDLLTKPPSQEELDEYVRQAAQRFINIREELSEISKISLNLISSKITSTKLHFLIEALEGKASLDPRAKRFLEEKYNLKLDLKDSAFTAITDVANSIDGECSINVREVRLNNFKDIFNPILFRKAIKITISGNISKEPEFTHAKRFVELHHFGKFEVKDSTSETNGEVSITLPVKTVTTNGISSLENTLLPVYKKAGNFSYYIFGISLIFLLVTAEWNGKVGTNTFKTTENSAEKSAVSTAVADVAQAAAISAAAVAVAARSLNDLDSTTQKPKTIDPSTTSYKKRLKINPTGCKTRGPLLFKLVGLLGCL